MDVRLLGPLEVLADGRRIQIARGREGALLALLAINAGQPVAVDRLVEELWEGEPPEHAAKSVQIYVSRLRKALGNELIATTGSGYLLRLGPEQLDVARFEAAANEGKAALGRGDLAAAERTLAQALALWRGDPLGDFRFARFAQDEIRRLEELRSSAEADYADVQLARGEVEATVPRLRALIEAQPLWERPRAQLMLALYRAGRAAEALELYRSTHSLFDRELGLEPSPELAELQRKILNQDESLGAAPRALPLRAQARRVAPLALAGGALLAAAAVATALLLSRGGGGVALTSIAPDSLGAIDPHTNKLALQVGVGSSPTGVAVGGGRVWVAGGAREEIVSVDPHAGRVLRRIPLAAVPTQIAVGANAVWVTNPLNIDAGLLTRVDLRTQVVSRVSVRTAYVADLFAPATPNVLALDGDTAWTDTQHARLVHVVGNTSTRFDTGPGHSIDGLAVGAGSIWIASSVDDTVLRFDPSRRRLATPPIHLSAERDSRAAGPAALAYGAGSVWIADALGDTVKRIDPRTNTVTATIQVGTRPTALAIGEGGVWVLNAGDGSVTHIDPADNRVVATVAVGRSLTGIAAGAGRVWVTVAGGRAPHTARPLAPARPLVTGSCGPLESGGRLPDLVIATDFPEFDNAGRVNLPIVDIRRAISAVVKDHGFRAGRYRVGLQHCTDSNPGDSPDYPLCAANARAYAGDASVVGVVGAYQSACSMVELPILDSAPSGPVAMISPSNTYVGLTHEGPQTSPTEPDRYYPIGVRNYVRLVGPDDAQGAGLALLAKQLHRRRLFLLDDGDPTAAAMVDYVAHAANRLGLSIVGRAHWGQPDYGVLARRVLRSRPSAVVLTGCICSHGGDLVVALRRALGRSVALLASDNFTFSGDMAGPGAPPEVFGVYISSAGTDPAAVSAFPLSTRIFLRHVFPGRPLTDLDRFVPLAAAATQALLEAIRRSDGSRASIVDELTRGRVAGTFIGGVSFDANGDPPRDPVSIYRISKAARPGPHLPVSGLKLDRVIEADPGLSGP